MQKICVLIPSYNESKTIGGIVKDLRRMNLACYVVDDGSIDNTSDIASSMGAIVLRNEQNSGKGASLKIGFRRVVDDGYDAVIMMDGDGQHDTGDIETLIRRMADTNADMVIGNRMDDTRLMPLVRVAVNRFMSYIISKMAGARIPDTQCGFRLIRRGVLENIKLQYSKFDMDSEMIIRAAWAGFKIESAPIKTVYRDEKSRINPIIDTLRFFRLLAKIRRG